jgi:trigger factor
MKSAVEPLEGNKVKVSVEIEESEFEQAVDAAFRKIAREVRIPGFRPGKAPRRILEARLGKETGRSEALQDALPGYYADAIREHQVDAIAPPEIDITEGRDSGPLMFDAVVEVRPNLELSGYESLKVTVVNPEVTEEDIGGRIDRLRANFAELGTVDRPARTGDLLTINLKGSRSDEPVPGMTISDYSYELGSGDVLPELDEQLTGAKVGDILTFPAEHPDGTVELTVLVSEIKEKVLPEITDEWASDASEFDTVVELRADIVKQVGLMKRVQAIMALRNGVIEELVKLVDTDAPEPLVSSEIERQAHEFGHRLESQGATIAQYLEVTGQTEAEIVAGLRNGAVPAVKADLALRAVAADQHLEVSEEDLEAQYAQLATNYGLTVDAVRDQLASTDQLLAVRSDLRKNKALEWLVEHAVVVDAEGNLVDRALLTPPESDDVGHTDPETNEPSESGAS